jgi:hypothetical protein
MALDPSTAARDRILKRLSAENQQLMGRIAGLEENVRAALARPRSPTEMLDAIPGRRIESMLVGQVDFDITMDGKTGNPVTIQVSQDGPFVITHYPVVLWFPNAPSTTTNLRRWRPVASFPLPDQVVDEDIIDLEYAIVDGGAQRNFQNNPRGPLFSRPDALQPLPMPTLFAPNATIQFFPTFNKITWNSATPPTSGTLHVSFPGYRIVNL